MGVVVVVGVVVRLGVNRWRRLNFYIKDKDSLQTNLIFPPMTATWAYRWLIGGSWWVEGGCCPQLGVVGGSWWVEGGCCPQTHTHTDTQCGVCKQHAHYLE